MITRAKNNSTSPAVSRMVEDIVRCKWSLAVLGKVQNGVRRPGAMEHAIAGISKKVLNERLRKLVRFGILEKRSYAESPPRVEYWLTPFGERFSELMDNVERLQSELDSLNDNPSRSPLAHLPGASRGAKSSGRDSGQ